MNQIKKPYIREECVIPNFGTIYSSPYTSHHSFSEVSDAVLEKADERINFRDLTFGRLSYDNQHTLSLFSSPVNQMVLSVPKEKISTYWLNLSREKGDELIKNFELSTHHSKESTLKYDSNFDVKYFLSTLSEKECLPITNFSNIDTNNLHKDERMIWAHEDMVEQFQGLLQYNKISQLHIDMNGSDYINHMSKPFINLMWSLGVNSDFRMSHGPDRSVVKMIRGLKRSPVEIVDSNVKLEEKIDLYKPNNLAHSHFF